MQFTYLSVQVRQSASMTLVEIAQMVRIEDIGQHILTIILVCLCFFYVVWRVLHLMDVVVYSASCS